MKRFATFSTPSFTCSKRTIRRGRVLQECNHAAAQLHVIVLSDGEREGEGLERRDIQVYQRVGLLVEGNHRYADQSADHGFVPGQDSTLCARPRSAVFDRGGPPSPHGYGGQPSRLSKNELAWLANRSSPMAHASEGWRRERDSNPRHRFRCSGFQDHRHRPLGHPSRLRKRTSQGLLRRGRLRLRKRTTPHLFRRQPRRYLAEDVVRSGSSR
jgi:hypothetical protein